jgi:hypothetical protein
MADRRPTRGINQRVREPVRLPDPTATDDFVGVLNRSDRDDLRRLAKLLAEGEAGAVD